MAHDTYLTLDAAIGTIQAGDDQLERLDELTERIGSDEFYVPVTSAVPSKCIDGRTGAHGVAPNAAGGSETIMVADDLTRQRFASADGSTLGAYRATLAALRGQDLPIGGHTDDAATGARSGCGANDRLAEIYAFIAQNGEMLQRLAASLGVPVSDTTREKIVTRATARTTFSDGADLLAVLHETGGNDAADPLHGTHREVVAVINTVRGTSLDRDALEAEFGPQYEAFNVDVWSFGDAAEAIAESEAEISELVAAMTIYNLATAHVLCGPRMRVIVR